MTGFLTNNYGSILPSEDISEHFEEQIYQELDNLKPALYAIISVQISQESYVQKLNIEFDLLDGTKEIVTIKDFSYKNNLSISAKEQIRKKVGILVVLGVL